MPSRKRQSNRPDRRVFPAGALDEDSAAALIGRCRYAGAAFHKLKPADYGLTPPSAPRPNKSVCDDLRPMRRAEARALLEAGIRRGMVSFFDSDAVPKYIWAVDRHGEVFEAKTKPGREAAYHGYRLGDDDDFRAHILQLWKTR